MPWVNGLWVGNPSTKDQLRREPVRRAAKPRCPVHGRQEVPCMLCHRQMLQDYVEFRDAGGTIEDYVKQRKKS